MMLPIDSISVELEPPLVIFISADSSDIEGASKPAVDEPPVPLVPVEAPPSVEPP